ncbi:MAG: TatD family hydrolase, partial [Micrococcales bacterium]|nr:TatD family hydrolase [Micrococcales bacterium]
MARDHVWPPAPDRLPVEVIDNHTHLQMAAGSVTEHLDRAESVGVTRVLEVGCDLDGLEPTAALAAADRRVLAAVAIHPNEAALHAGVREVGPDGLAPRVEARHSVPLDDAIAAVARVAGANERVRVVGETGLDYFRTCEAGR